MNALQIRRIRVGTVADLVEIREDGTENVLLVGRDERTVRDIYEVLTGQPWTREMILAPSKAPDAEPLAPRFRELLVRSTYPMAVPRG